MTDKSPDRSDEELLALSVSGDDDAFETLVSRHHNMVHRIVGGLLAWSSDVNDAAQDVWLTAWRRRGAFENRSTVKTWITGIAIYVCRNRRRSRWFQRSEPTVPEEGVDFGDTVVMDENRVAVRSALRGLTLATREVAVLYYLEELSTAEIASQLALSPNTVDKRLQRAREQLRIILQPTEEPA